MQSLFPQSRPGTEAEAPVVQFRAGKCTMSSVQANGKYTVTPEARPGRISLSKGNDGLMHFKWTNGVTNAVEDDRIVFPGEYVFKRVKTGREEATERVYMLKYQTGQQRMMYWLQDKATDKDEEIVKKVNDFLTNPNAVTVAPAAAGGAGGAPGVVSPDEWMRLIGYVKPYVYYIDYDSFLLDLCISFPQPNFMQTPILHFKIYISSFLLNYCRLNAGGAGMPPAAPASSAAAAEPSPFGSLDLSQILRAVATSSSTSTGSNSTLPAPAPSSGATAAAPATTATSSAAEQDSTASSTADATTAPDDSNNNDTDNNDGGGNSGEGPMEQ